MRCELCKLVDDDEVKDGEDLNALEYINGQWICEQCYSEINETEDDRIERALNTKEDELLGYDALLYRGFD